MSLKGKLLLVGLGVGVGYILGAKAGRERYDQIARKASAVWHSPVVTGIRDTATAFVDDRLDDLAGLLKLGAASAIDRATGAKQRRSRGGPVPVGASGTPQPATAPPEAL